MTKPILSYQPTFPVRNDLMPGSQVSIHESSASAFAAVTRGIADLIRRRDDEGRPTVMGLATCSTLEVLNEDLVRLHRDEGLCFKNVVTFYPDEYWPKDSVALQSYHRFMAESLFDHIDPDPANVRIPDDHIAQEPIVEYCRDYGRRIRLEFRIAV
jgi:glucosamine-6-phosphate deaminase